MQRTGKEKLMNYDWGYAYVNGFVVLDEGPDTFRLEAITTGGSRIR